MSNTEKKALDYSCNGSDPPVVVEVLSPEQLKAKNANFVQIAAEHAPFWAKLTDSGYLMVHPALLKKGLCWVFLSSFFEALLALGVIGYFVTELTLFSYLLSNYGWR